MLLNEQEAKLRADFLHDVAVRCLSLLQAAGYNETFPDDDSTIRAYVSVKHRRVASQVRRLHKAQYTVPAHLLTGEKMLTDKVSAGQDLWPHQSRKISRSGYEDGMLNDFGIQHFHLGTVMDSKRPNLIEGTREAMFALVRDDDFYAIGIFDHDAWSKQALLDIVENNWPSLMDPYTIKGVVGISNHYTDEEIQGLRNAGLNVLTQGASGSVRVGMGGGISGAGTSVAVTRQADQLLDQVERIQATAISEFFKIGAPNDLEIYLDWSGDGALVASKPIGWTGKTGLILPQI